MYLIKILILIQFLLSKIFKKNNILINNINRTSISVLKQAAPYQIAVSEKKNLFGWRCKKRKGSDFRAAV